MVIPPRANVEYTIAETDSTVSLSTSQLTATVSFSTGDVKFYNKDGRLIVAEADGGREFTPIEVEGTKGYTVRQVFESLDKEEGIYGLGQHQSDEFNYKGKTKNFSSTIPKSQCHSLSPLTTTAFFGIAIRSAASEIRNHTNNSAGFSNSTIKTARKAL